MSSIIKLSNAVIESIPQPAEGWKTYRQTAPRSGDKPPWIIETITTDAHLATETMHVHSGISRLDIRIVSETTDAVDVIADDLMIPKLAGRHIAVDGFSTGALVLDVDSGAYATGLTAESTALLYQCRLLTFRFNWSRNRTD